ncbi:SDR family oxidoreductase [Ktedonosporobacter rubrisoli]|uniref:SDR family oxidoreductase n=1 Tax=Ktedonosporobacter rubrisoli TaxID=2509675 RepID=A0A4P6JQE5_KTERU|nr:SDR family oxidoreductase [Ktedonosporobacter rubrisoli]QBD77629.1 SDR family oxidoreductase [Ktedonosporobacter rubrisoli]
MDLHLQGKVALITGGSKGIGRQVALTFAQEGAHVVLCARTPADLELARSTIEAIAPNCKVCTVEADLRSEEGAQKAVNAALDYFAGVDILVNCAGAAPGRLLSEIDDETWHEALALKFLGYVRMIKSIVPHFLKRGSGVIVNVVGNDGVKPSYWELTGTAANAADLAVMQALADQYGRYNIRINSVNPGPVDTGRWDSLTAAFARDKDISLEVADSVAKQSIAFGRICTPQEVANVVVFLASERASFVHGTSLTIDGNQRKAIMDV